MTYSEDDGILIARATFKIALMCGVSLTGKPHSADIKHKGRILTCNRTNHVCLTFSIQCFLTLRENERAEKQISTVIYVRVVVVGVELFYVMRTNVFYIYEHA